MNACRNNRIRGYGPRFLRPAAALCLALFASGVPAAFTPPAELTVGTDVNYPPYYNLTADGRGQGIVVDKWNLWSKRTGIPVKIEASDWASAQRAILAGKVDVLDPISYLESRQRLYEFSRPYAKVEARVYFHRSISGISDVASMNGFSVGAKDGSACALWLAERGISMLRKYATAELLVQAAAAGEVRLFCMDSPTAEHFLFKSGVADEFRETPPLYSTNFHWVVKQGRTELRDFIQQGFDRIKPEELAEIDARWVGSPLQSPLTKRYFVYAGVGAAVLLALGVLLLAWNRALQQRVALRTADLNAAMALIRADAERIHVLYNNAPCGYHSLSRDGTFISVNDTELEWLGEPREAVVGKRKFEDYLTEQGRREFAVNHPVFLEQGGIRDLEYQIVNRRDGGVRTVLLSAKMVRDAQGRDLMSSSTLHDITARRIAEDKLRELNIELENRIQERTAQLSTANKELSAFSYSLSHDLRAPLRSIDGFSKLLLERYAGYLDDQGRSYIQRLRRAGTRIGLLIDDMLRLSRVSFLELHLADIDVSRVAHEIAGDLAHAHPERRVQFAVADGLKAVGDPGLLRIVLENLIGNAWKYTSKKAAAKIEVGRAVERGVTSFYVRDDGAGFDMEFAEKLFEPFQRLHNSAEFEGTGIGLATVQRVIDRHRGRVWAEGSVGQGATVFFTLGPG
jgi:PAS domain S-box-containing protein